MMELPQPPQDEDLRNIIEKLAVFVARNGQEFESMTKQKQRDNPRFAFLFGGEFFDYYKYRMTTEQIKFRAQTQQQQQQMQNQQNPNFGNFGPPQQNQRFPRPQIFDQQQQQQQQFENRFDRPGFDFEMQNFDGPPRHRGPPPQREFVERPRCPPPPRFDRFDQRGPPPGNFRGNFDRPPRHFDIRPGGPRPNFEPPSNFDRSQMTPQRQEFDRPGPNFEPPSNFDRSQMKPQRQEFDRPGPNFENRPPQREVPPAPIFHQIPNQQQPQVMPPQQQQQQHIIPPQQQQQHIIPPQQQQQQQPPQQIAPQQQPQQLQQPINVEALQAQKTTLEEQIRQSEQNLQGQHQVLMVQQKKQIEESLRIMQDAEIEGLALELNINLEELDAVLQPIIESCTKDAISSGKAWIFTHTSTQKHYHLLTQYLLKITTDPSAPFNKRLHIIYLINDVLHHCMRKGADDLQQALEGMVIPMFCYSKVVEAASEENLAKLNKLFSLWESKSNYVSEAAVEKLRDYQKVWQDYQNELLARHAVVGSQIAANIQQTYEGYQKQHQMFTSHVIVNIKNIEQQIQQGIQQQQQRNQMMVNVTSSLPGLPTTSIAVVQSTGYPGNVQQQQQQQFIQQQQQPGGNNNSEQKQQGPPVSLPLDISRPPPGFPTPPPEKDLIPALPYYELPAGLMVQLVKLEDDNYKPMDPKLIRLPPPCPPTEKLLQAVEAFYGPPSHDRPRDSEGWERLGLYEYFKTKNIARKQKEDDMREGRRQKSRSPTPIKREGSETRARDVVRSPPRRRYQSKSPTSTKRRRSRSRSPPPPPQRRGRRNRRSKSRSPPPRRSPTPPSFGTVGLGMETKLDESNKGHQLLKKMGWGGLGLGLNEQGIEAPISGGELRDKQDQYKGVGVPSSNKDPFEAYRKSKGQAFVGKTGRRLWKTSS